MSQNDALNELLARRGLTQDAARADAVAARRAAGRRTARENIADLVDEGSFVEYGQLATAAQEQRRTVEDLLRRSPADGLVGGTARINGAAFAEAAACAVLSYDYLVMAGTQGIRGHHKSDRLLSLIERMRLPTVFFTEGGGGRPSDTDYPVASALDVQSFQLWARLSGVVPRVAVVSGQCFAGNAILAGCSDVVVATREATMGVAGPAMVASAGLGEFSAAELGPVDVLASAGVVDLVVSDDRAAVAAARRVLGYFQGRLPCAPAGDQTVMRTMVPERERVAYDVRPVVVTLADPGSVTFLREAFAPELVTALTRIDGRAVGVLANQSLHMAGAITSDAADKAARFLQLCDAFGLPVVSLVDTPGIMAGPEAERTGVVRHASRLLVAGAHLSVPLVGVVLRRGYGLGAQAMLGGSTRAPLLTVAWPGAHLGPMGLEGAVRLTMRRELAAIGDEAERERVVQEQTQIYQRHVHALNVARLFEIDDVVDPAQTRHVVAATLAAACAQRPGGGSSRPVDTW